MHTERPSNIRTPIAMTDVQRVCYLCGRPATYFIAVFAARTRTTQRPVCTEHSH